jgi:hypothetical protein
MEHKPIKTIFLMLLIFAAACDEPETVVTNIIHTDGSVTRKIEMRNTKNKFDKSVVQVPIDSTWSVKDSISIGVKNDTTWFKTAEKSFKNVEEINGEYLNENGANRKIPRSASFTRKFRWFNTVYTFSEKLDKSLLSGYPLEKFMTKDELDFFYLPESIITEKLSGADSTKYKEMNNSIKTKTDRCFWSSAVSEWIEEFSKLTAGRGDEKFTKEKLKLLESKIVDTIIVFEPKGDSVIYAILGTRGYKNFKAEADSAEAIVDKRLEPNISFAGYTVIFVMPGRVTASNGFIMRNGEIMWPVKSEFFMSQTYEMHAESKMPNVWAWVVSGLFLLFVLTGTLWKINKKG